MAGLRSMRIGDNAFERAIKVHLDSAESCRQHCLVLNIAHVELVVVDGVMDGVNPHFTLNLLLSNGVFHNHVRIGALSVENVTQIIDIQIVLRYQSFE